MPFTPTHILAIVPIARLLRGWLPFSALAIGAMIPDLPLFVPWISDYDVTHSFVGAATVCTPLGVALFYIYHRCFKRPLHALMPSSIRSRTELLANSQPRFAIVPLVTIAVLLGAITHLVWDAFTHEGRWGTELIPALNQVAFVYRSQPVPGYKVVQYCSTFLGMPLLIVLALRWLRDQPVLQIKEKEATLSGLQRLVIATLAIALVTATFCVTIMYKQEHDSAYLRLGRAIKRSGMAAMLVCAGYGLVYQSLWRQRSREVESTPPAEFPHD